MIDFTYCEVNKFKTYGGGNGSKINIRYDGADYMLKFSALHSSRCITEYLACHIVASLGIPAQETLLGMFTDKHGKEKVVVACRDFTTDSKKLMEFAHLKNTCIDTEQSGYNKELSSIMAAIDEQLLVPSEKLREFFWDMFIADALLGNSNRHNENWGILVDEQRQVAEIAPVYGCSSCLYPQMDVADMERALNSEKEINEKTFAFPASAIEESGKKISYFEFIASHKNAECNEALRRITARIDMEKINRLIEETPGLLPIQRDFYRAIIKERKEKIIDYSMKMLTERERILS